MEKIKPSPRMNDKSSQVKSSQVKSSQVKSSQVKSSQVKSSRGILFLMENISPYFMPLVERKPCERNRNGA